MILILIQYFRLKLAWYLATLTKCWIVSVKWSNLIKKNKKDCHIMNNAVLNLSQEVFFLKKALNENLEYYDKSYVN